MSDQSPGSPGPTLLDVEGVSRRFGYHTVLHDVTLRISSGDVVVLLGPNGAGKSTLLRVLAGLLRPHGGRIRREGTLGLVGHRPMLYGALTARENLQFFSRLQGINGGRADALLDAVGLVGAGDSRVRTFSQGMIKRLAIARALLNDPDLLLLDEPFSGLDDHGVDVLRGVIEQRRDTGTGVVVVTHVFGHVASLHPRTGILVGGALHGPDPGENADAVRARYRDLVLHE